MKNLTTKKNVGFLRMLEGTLAASLLGNMLAGKAVIWAGEGVIRVGEKRNQQVRDKLQLELVRIFNAVSFFS